jgi:uncharacterized pyridoxamine 5'-phosphate oxidase family protein
MNEVAEFLKDCGVFYVATCQGDQPRVRPFGALDIFEDKLYIVTNNQKKVFSQLQSDPKVEICGMNARKQWIRVAATVVVDGREQARRHMLETNPGLTRMYAADDGLMEVAYLKDAVATIDSFAETSKVIRF